LTILRPNSFYFLQLRTPPRAVRLGAVPSLPISAMSRGSFYVLHANWSLPASNAPSQTFPWERSTVLPFSRRDVFLNLPPPTPFTLQPLLSPVYLDVSFVMTGFRVRSAFHVFSHLRNNVSRRQVQKIFHFYHPLLVLGARCWCRSWLRHCARSWKGRGFDSRCCHKEFFIDIILPAALCPCG